MTMRKLKVDKTTLIPGLAFGVPFLFLLCLNFKYHQDQKLPGIVDYQAGHNEKAIQELQDYLKDHPCSENHSLTNSKSEFARKYLGLAYLEAHQDQQAVDVFKDPCIRSSFSQYNLGVALMRQGKLQEARTAFTTCIDLEGGGKFTNATLIHDAEGKIAKIDRLR